MATKVGVIGAGGMAEYHIQGFRQAGAEVFAMADVNEEAAKATAGDNDIPNVFGDVAEMLASDIDAVSIIVPNTYHENSTSLIQPAVALVWHGNLSCRPGHHRSVCSSG